MRGFGQEYMQEYGQGYYGKPESAFTFEVGITGVDETFTLPIYNGGTYDFNVDWGDGSDDDISAWDDAAVTHTYASADIYEIKITGIITGWRFANAGDKLKIYDIRSWGPLNLGIFGLNFYGCANLTVSATDILDLTGTATFAYIFYGCSSLTALDVSSWDVGLVLSFAYTFYNCSLTTLAADNWADITSVVDMVKMFYGITLTTVNYSNILIAFEAQAVQDNVVFSGGNSKYSAGAAATARQALIDDHNWTITDGGQV